MSTNFQETQQKLKLTWWPTPQDYNEAIQIPRGNLQDAELQQAVVYTDANGLPRPVTGSFASVYRLHCQDKNFALRLFLRNISDQDERYALISDFVQHDDLPYTVTFDFLKTGIKVMGEWLPALKMEWVEGPSFDDYIVANVANSDKLGHLNESFVIMMNELGKAGIAHGDLQHGNIIVCRNELRLVDYDGMFVPAMQGWQASELGHRNYQHPARAAKHFGPYLDNFSAWIIYASVKALQIDSRLLHQLGGGDDCLLFRQTDFLDPLHSSAFAAFERHQNKELNLLGRFIRAQLKKDPADVPPLQLPVPPVADSDLELIVENAPTVRTGPRLIRGALPDWLEHPIAHMLGGAAAPTNSSPANLYQSWAVPANQAPPVPWTKPAKKIEEMPPELYSTKSNRKIEFNYRCGRRPPDYFQQLLLPVIWLLVLMLGFTWLLQVQILEMYFGLLFVVAAEAAIWIPTLRDRMFAKLGVPLIARVTHCFNNVVYVSYTPPSGQIINNSMPVSSGEFWTFVVGGSEVILCDADNPENFVFYRHCRYNVYPAEALRALAARKAAAALKSGVTKPVAARPVAQQPSPAAPQTPRQTPAQQFKGRRKPRP